MKGTLIRRRAAPAFTTFVQRGILRLSLSAILGTLLFFTPARALAFCRTTTCKCSSDKKLPDAPNGMPRTTCGAPDGDCPKDEHGCVMKGTPVAWAGGCVGYSPNLIGTAQLSDEQWKEAFRQAFHAWQLVDCGGGAHPSIELFALRATSCAESSFNPNGPNINSIYFTDQGWSGPQADLDHVLARAKVNFASTGEIVDADISINSARKEFTVTDDVVKEDLVSILTHEVGHFLGIAHSDVPNAVMYWTYGAGTTRRELQQDDIDAICAIYPPDREVTCDPTPVGGLDTCGPRMSIESGCSTTGALRTHPSSTSDFNVRNDGSGGHIATYGIGILGFVVVRRRIVHRCRTRGS